MVDTSCMSLDHITTSTCLPEPVTSSGHPSLLHLGDESVIRNFNVHLISPLPAFHCHIISLWGYFGPAQLLEPL